LRTASPKCPTTPRVNGIFIANQNRISLARAAGKFRPRRDCVQADVVLVN